MLGHAVVTGMMCATPMMASKGSGQMTMTVVSGTSTFEPFPGVIVTLYTDGYLGLGGGALEPDTFNGVQIGGLYWLSTADHATGGFVQISLAGNRPDGFVTSVSCDGSDLGAIGSASYDAYSDQTTFIVGTTGNNPFGTSGTRTIVIT